EISRKIDVPLHFVQEEVETLTDHELMRQVGSRYQTDFVILRHEAYKAQSDALAEVGSAIAQPLLRSIFALQDRIQAIEHYDAGKSFAEQLWTLVPFVFKETHLQSAIPVTDAMAVYPLRKDGSRWLVIGSETRDIKACGVS